MDALGRGFVRPTMRLPFYYGWVIVLVSAIGMAATAPGQTYTVAVFVDPIGASLDLSKTGVSTAYTIGGALAALVVLQVGRVIDRVGVRRAMIGGGIVFGLTCIGMGAVNGMVALVVGFGALRVLGPGTLSLSSTVLPTRWFTRRRGLALGLVTLGSGLGHAVMPTVTRALIEAFTWRGAWIGLAVMVWVLVLLPAIFLVHERPEAIGLRPDGEVTRSGTASRAPSTTRPDWTLGQAARTPTYWILMATGVAQSMIGTGIIFHQVSYFAEQGLLDQLAMVFAIFAVAQTTSMTATGVVLDRVAPHLVLTGLQLMFTAAIGLMLVLSAVPIVLPAYAALLGTAMGGMNTFGSVVWPAYYGTRHLATMRSFESGIKMTAAAIGPLPLAIAYDYLGGYMTGLVLFALLTGASAVIGFACRPPAARPGQHVQTVGTPP